MSKAALGRGLESLIPTTGYDTFVGVDSNAIKKDSGGNNIIAKIEISKIDKNPLQPRVKFDPVALSELKNSIIQKGIIQPITVRRNGTERYELISGERRIRASIEAGMRLIPAYIIDVASNKEMLELAIIENIQREFLDPIETAQAYKRLAEEYKYTHEEIAKKVSKDRSSITNFIRLLKLPEKIQASISNNEISMGHAKVIIALPNAQTQLEVFKQVVKKGLSVRATEKLSHFYTDQKKDKKIQKNNPRYTAGLRYENVTSQIRSILSTKVVVEKNKDKEGGKIFIEYYSDDDLSRLLELFETIQK
jgi:ParB family chromosome partitioning protein